MKKLKILLVDDHQLILQAVERSLVEIGNIEYVSTRNCQEAFELFKKESFTTPFDVVFTDLSFDNISSHDTLTSGEELIRAIKTHSKTPPKIGVITGHSEVNRIFSVVTNLSPDAYILKSKCDTSELQFAISSMLKDETYYTHEVHQALLKRSVVEIMLDETALKILQEIPNHPKISNLEGIIKKEGIPLKLRSIENKLSNLRVQLNANNNIDLYIKAQELGLID